MKKIQYPKSLEMILITESETHWKTLLFAPKVAKKSLNRFKMFQNLCSSQINVLIFPMLSTTLHALWAFIKQKKFIN